MQHDPEHDTRASADLARIAAALEGLRRDVTALSRRLDEFADAFLNAKFPYGRATDRWSHPRRGIR